MIYPCFIVTDSRGVCWGGAVCGACRHLAHLSHLPPPTPPIAFAASLTPLAVCHFYHLCCSRHCHMSRSSNHPPPLLHLSRHASSPSAASPTSPASPIPCLLTIVAVSRFSHHLSPLLHLPRPASSPSAAVFRFSHDSEHQMYSIKEISCILAK